MRNRSTNSKTLTELYEIAEDNQITIVESRCPECKALSMLSPIGKCYIGIDHRAIKNEREERQYLAHDIGHCVKGAFYNPYSPYSLISQQEYRADKEAVNFLVPRDELITVIKSGCTDMWELCEYFDVDEKYIKKAYWEYFDVAI